MSAKPTVGFVGLGAMGFGMATHLVKRGYTVRGFDAFPASVERFGKAGGIPATSLRASADRQMYYICMVASASQVKEVLFHEETGIIKVLPQGATFLSCSTISSADAKSIEKEMKERGRDDIYYIDSPVSGGIKRAADGTLAIMAGGHEAALERGKFLLQEMSGVAKLYIIPGGIGAGSNMKMVHQVLAGIHILGASEAMGFAARLGLDANEVKDAIIKSEARTWMHENRVQRMLEEDWIPGASAITIILKDLGIVTSVARMHNIPVPLSSAAEQTYLTALMLGWGARDDSAMVRMYFPDPILSVKTKHKSPEETANICKVIDLMKFTNICAAVEAIAFAKYLRVDMDQFYDLVTGAAGNSHIFTAIGAKMIPTPELEEHMADIPRIDEVVQQFTPIIQLARDLHCPLSLGTEALNQFLFAQRRGLGSEKCTRLLSLWDSDR